VSRDAAQVSRAPPMPETDTPPAAARRPWRISTQSVVIGQVALLLIVITILSGVSVWREYDAAVSRAEIQAGNAAQTASEHVRWLYEASSQALRRVDDLLHDNPDAMEAGSVGNLGEAVTALPRDTSLTVYNAQGQSILSTDPERAQPNIAQREDFRVHESGHEWHIGAMVDSRATNRPVFTISRRVDVDGEFAGAAVVVVPVELLARFWATLSARTPWHPWSAATASWWPAFRCPKRRSTSASRPCSSICPTRRAAPSMPSPRSTASTA